MGNEDQPISVDKKGVSTFNPPSKTQAAAWLSGEAARAAQTSEFARKDGDPKAADRLLKSAKQKSDKALDDIK